MTAFTYHRAIAPMMWVVVGLSSIELLVVHLLVSHWLPRFAITLSLLTLAGVIWLIWAIVAMRSRPVEVGPDGLVMRVGGFKSVSVPVDAVASVTAAGSERDRSALNLALVAHPNVMVELREPLAWRRRSIQRIAHRLDDPAGFIAAAEEVIRGSGQPATGSFTPPSASRFSGP